MGSLVTPIWPVAISSNVGTGRLFSCREFNQMTIPNQDACVFSSQQNAQLYCITNPFCAGVVLETTLFYPVQRLSTKSCLPSQCFYAPKVVANSTIEQQGLWPATLRGNFWIQNTLQYGGSLKRMRAKRRIGSCRIILFLFPFF